MELQLSQQARFSSLRQLTEVSRALTYAMSLDEVLKLTVRHAVDLLQAKKAILMLTDGHGMLSVRASVGIDESRCKRFAEPLDESLNVRLRGLLDVDASHFLGVPLVVGGQVIGILAVSAFVDATSSDEQEWLLSALADQASVALQKTKLDEIIEFRDRLIGIVSHDLRTPVTAILISCRTLLKRKDTEPQSLATVRRIRSCAERANRMIRDLLDYTQAHIGGGIRIQKRPADLQDIVEHAVAELSIANAGRVIDVNASGETHGNWDQDRLGQVVRNLLSNALHYSPPDTPVSIDIEDAAEGGVSLSVKNGGLPIPEARLPYIFEPMQRATASSDASNRSVGLGLYIVKHLVEAHGGTVEVTSEMTRGTRFTVWLPRDVVVQNTHS